MQGLIVIPELPWPPHDGQSVMAHHLAQAMLDRGHRLHVLLGRAPKPEHLRDWPLADRVTFEAMTPRPHGADPAATRPARSKDAANDRAGGPMAPLRRRWLRYWGWPADGPAQVAAAARASGAEFVQGFGLSVCPLLSAVPADVPTIWVAGDDWCLHHLTLLRPAGSWAARLRRLRTAARMAAYERSFAGCLDAAVAVSPRDCAALRRLGGMRRVASVPNGVDTRRFTPADRPPEPRTLLFWGRLDFQPNIDAVRWFARHVWPALRRRHRDARWWIVGREPGPAVRRIVEAAPGAELIGPVDRIADYAHRAATIVIPMRSGAGIKNKLLEAAAMGRPIVATPRATAGLHGLHGPAWLTADRPDAWLTAIQRLWADPAYARWLAARARAWVVARHDWSHAAAQHEALIRSCMSGRRRRAAIPMRPPRPADRPAPAPRWRPAA